MAEMTTDEAKEILAETEGAGDGDLVKRLRAVANSKITAAEGSQMSPEDMAELAGYRRNALFDQAGIGNSSNEEKLFRQALSSREDLTLEAIQTEAAKYGLTGESAAPANPASAEEIAAHGEIASAAGEAPSLPASIEERMKAAKSLDELRALEREAGLDAGEDFLDIFD